MISRIGETFARKMVEGKFFRYLFWLILRLVLGVLGLTLVEGIVVARGEVEPIFLFMSLSGGDQPAPGFCRHVYPDGSFAPYFQ